MLSVIVFSKDRPLQLHGYLESLLHYSNVVEEDITVILKETNGLSYKNVKNSFKRVQWIEQTVFFDNLTEAIKKAKDYLMFGCDDVVFSSSFRFEEAISLLKSNLEIFGFSLRLGSNIYPKQVHFSKSGKMLIWDWTKTDSPSWNYPWELDATIYNKADVIKIISALKTEDIKNPNYLEAEIANNPYQFVHKTKMGSFQKSKCLVITVNRVQNSVINDFDDSKNLSPERLQFLYEKGLRLYYLYFKKNRIIHVDSTYFNLIPKWQFSLWPLINLFLFIRYLLKYGLRCFLKICSKFYKLISIIRFGGTVSHHGNKIVNQNGKKVFKTKQLKITIYGKNNLIQIDQSVYMEKSSIFISGNNNHVVLKSNVHGIVDIQILSDMCRVEIDEKTGFTGTKIVLGDKNSTVTFGRECIVAKDTIIYVTDFHSVIDFKTGYPINQGRYIKVGNHCWIGEGVKILKNTRIEDDVIVGAFSLVSRDLDEPHSVYAGVPAKKCKENVSWDYAKYDDYKRYCTN